MAALPSHKHHRYGAHAGLAGDGHNQASHQWYTNLYGDNLHPREWNSLNIEHTDLMNYGRLSAIDRCIRTAGQRMPVGPAMRSNPVSKMVFGRKAAVNKVDADWHQFYHKYMLSQPETKYDTALSLATEVRSSAYLNKYPIKLGPSEQQLAFPTNSRVITNPK